MGSEVAQLLEAADFAARKHQRQRRKDPEGTPYINHPIGGRSAGGATAVASRGWGPGRERGGRAAPRAPSGYLALYQAQFVFKTHSDLERSAWLFPVYSGHPKKKSKGRAQGHPASEGRPPLALQNPHHAALNPLLTSCFAPSGVARILTHEAGITDIVVLQVTLLLC